MPRPPKQAPKALIVPQAGYIYSGSTAALAYAQLRRAHAVVRRVILRGPAHRVCVRGLGLCNSGDTAGDRDRVVGYGAFAFWEQQARHTH